MSGFTKLVPEIVQSSVWMESSDVRIVWIYILAMKDENGFIRGDAERFAHFARVPIEAAQEAIRKFTSPDSKSATPDDDGRRLLEMPGGFVVVNHGKYRCDRREYMRDYMKEYRKREPVNSVVNTVKLTSASASDSSSQSSSGIPEGDTKGGAHAKPAKPVKRHHGEFQRVLLTDDEHAKLLEAYGDRFPAAIEVLDTYLEAKGRKYRSHYAVMKKHGWVWERVFQGKGDAAIRPDAAPARDPEDMQVDRYREMETYLLKAELRDAEETERLNREFFGDSEREMKWDYAKLVISRARKALQERGEGAS